MLGHPLKIISINANTSSSVTEDFLQHAVENKTDLILVQEPWYYGRGIDPPRTEWGNFVSTTHSSFMQIPPNHSSNYRPRTLAYVSKTCKLNINLATESPTDTDIQILDVTDRNNTLQIINLYNQRDQAGSNKNTFQRHLQEHLTPPNAIIIGDFNAHHPWWEPHVESVNTADELLVEWLENNNLDLRNKPGEITWRRVDSESVIDLAFTTPPVTDKCTFFTVNTDISSDHFGLQLDLAGDDSVLVENPALQVRYNTNLADWEAFRSKLTQTARESHELNTPEFGNHLVTEANSRDIIEENNDPLTNLLDKTAQALTKAITDAADMAIPRINPSAKAKPWWTPELKELRQDKGRLHKEIVPGDLPSAERYLEAKRTYFNAVKDAKRQHWNQFLQKEDPKSIFRALKYTKGNMVQRIPLIRDLQGVLQSTFQGKCNAFRSTLFPPPPNATKPEWEDYQGNHNKWIWPLLTRKELEEVCSNKVQSKSPGPGGITQEIITHAFAAIPDYFFRVYSVLINLGYHPTCWKTATGAILPKTNKPDYAAPKAYRIITLLNCLGKLSERIVAKRLGFWAETTNLLSKTQIGGRLKKSAIDAALLLTNEIERNKKRNWKTSTVFLDVKGAYDHVAKYRLFKILQQLWIPLCVIAWIASFLNLRQLGLAFDGEIQQATAIVSGVPQGSPVSPILFLIYIRDLFTSTNVTWISYVDDISMTTASRSFKNNIKTLEREAQKLYQLAAENQIEFDLAKTELIHWGKSPNDTSIKLPNNTTIEPKPMVKWLGIYFDSDLSFKHHVSTKVAKARGAFFRMSRLANIGRGLTPFALRQIYTACVMSIADYGTEIWWRGQQHLTKLLQGVQNLAIRKILGVFKTAPILPMEVESALPPPQVRLNANLRRYAFRLLKLSPNHPINEATNKIISPNERPTKEYTKPPLQLRRIYESISDLYNKNELEPIQHHFFAPWDRDTHFEVEISKLPKDEEAKLHTKTVQNNPHNNIFIYTDASSTSVRGSTGIGIGMAVFSPPSATIHHQKMINIGDQELVYNGELHGVTTAIEYANKIAKPGLQFHIYSDNQAGLWRLKTPSDNAGQECQIRAIKAAKNATEKGAKITLKWVPGHTDILGNETADLLAKSATFIIPQSTKTSFAMLGLKIKELKIKEWYDLLNNAKGKTNYNRFSYKKHFPWRIQSKLRTPAGTPRKIASAFYQLKLGHGYLKSYLQRVKHSTNDRCRCGQSETTEHLILSCPETTSARRHLTDKFKGEISLQLLLHTKVGTEAMLEFLQETQIATREWHLGRNEELAEEEEEE